MTRDFLPENPLKTHMRLDGREQALYRLSDKNGFSIQQKGFRYAEMMGDHTLVDARKFAVVSEACPDLTLEIVVRGISTKRPFCLEVCDLDKPLSRQDVSEYERIAELVDRLNAQYPISEPPTTQPQSTKRITAGQKDKRDRQARVKKYCERGQTIAEMAESENVSESTIKRDLKDLGLTTR